MVSVTPAEAGVHLALDFIDGKSNWIPAYAGMTSKIGVSLALIMSNECEVYFGLFGNFDPESLALGIAATRVCSKGVPAPKDSQWVYSSGKFRGDVIDVYKVASSVVQALEPHAERIMEAKNRPGLEAVLEVVLTISPSDQVPTPAIGFESDVISFLSKVGASIDVDTYRAER